MAQGENLPVPHTRVIGRSYYVDAALGSDSHTEANARDNPSNPWATIQKAVDTFAFPGANSVAIRVRKTGIYQASAGVQATVSISGKATSSTQYLIIMADDPGARPVVRIVAGTTGGQHDAFQIGTTQKYVIIDGFEIDSSGRPGPASGTNDGTGVYVSGTGSGGMAIELWNLWIHNLMLSATGPTTGKVQGIFSERHGTDQILIYNCKIHDIGTTVEGEAQNDLEHGMYVHGSMWIINTLIYNITNGFGLQIYDGDAAIDGVRVVHCTLGPPNTDKPNVTVDPRESTNIVFRNSILKGSFGTINIENEGGAPSGVTDGRVIDHVINKAFTGTSPISNAVEFAITNHITNQDPKFLVDGSDFRIMASSPAKGYVDNTYSPSFDLDKNPRPVGQEDAGAYQSAELGFDSKRRASLKGQPWPG